MAIDPKDYVDVPDVGKCAAAVNAITADRFDLSPDGEPE